MSHIVLLLYLAVFAHFILETSNYTVGIMVSSGAITKHYRLDGLNNRIFFLAVLEAGKSKVKVLQRSIPVRALLLAHRRPLPHYILTRWRASSLVSFYKSMNAITRPPS